MAKYQLQVKYNQTDAMKRFMFLLPILLACMSWALIPYALWASVTDGLLIFLGLLVAALVQVIPVTANFLQSDSLTVEEAQRLSAVLERQQKYWLGLLSVAVVACIALIIGKALPPEPINILSATVKGVSVAIALQSVFSAFIGALIGLVVIKTFGVFPGVLSLQRLRGELVINAAKRRAAESVQAAALNRRHPSSLVPDDYGQIIRPPH